MTKLLLTSCCRSSESVSVLIKTRMHVSTTVGQPHSKRTLTSFFYWILLFFYISIVCTCIFFWTVVRGNLFIAPYDLFLFDIVFLRLVFIVMDIHFDIKSTIDTTIQSEIPIMATVARKTMTTIMIWSYSKTVSIIVPLRKECWDLRRWIMEG